MSIGMLCLALGLTSNQFLRSNARLGENLVDGASGFLIGLALGLNLLSLRPRRCPREEI
jgi:hypothetical protein